MMMASVASSVVVSVESTCVVAFHHNESHGIRLLPSTHLSPRECMWMGNHDSMVDMGMHSRLNE